MIMIQMKILYNESKAYIKHIPFEKLKMLIIELN